MLREEEEVVQVVVRGVVADEIRVDFETEAFLLIREWMEMVNGTE